MRIMDCVLIYFYRKLEPYTVDPEHPCPKPSWDEALKLFNSMNFLQMLETFPLGTINDEMLELMEPITSMADYNYDNARRVYGDSLGLFQWTLALRPYPQVRKMISPLKTNLEHCEGKLAKAEEDVAVAQTLFDAKEAELIEAMQIYDKTATRDDHCPMYLRMEGA